MSLTPRLTLIGMYNYDSDLFHLLSLPDGMDKDLFINSLLMRYGENPVVFPTVPFFKQAVGVWSAKWYDSLERMLEAVTEEYNPLHNYDRHETYTDTETKESAGTDRLVRSDSETMTRTGTVVDDGSENSEYVTDTDTTSTTEKKISAENVSDYQPDEKTEDSGTLDSTVTGEVTKGNTRTSNETDNRTGTGTDTHTTSGNDDRTLQHTAHLYGNIGVTTSQQMLMEEIKLRKDLSIYDVAAELFYREFCLYVY